MGHKLWLSIEALWSSGKREIRTENIWIYVPVIRTSFLCVVKKKGQIGSTIQPKFRKPTLSVNKIALLSFFKGLNRYTKMHVLNPHLSNVLHTPQGSSSDRWSPPIFLQLNIVWITCCCTSTDLYSYLHKSQKGGGKGTHGGAAWRFPWYGFPLMWPRRVTLEQIIGKSLQCTASLCILHLQWCWEDSAWVVHHTSAHHHAHKTPPDRVKFTNTDRDFAGRALAPV